jgi:hexosaminidase
MEARKMRRINFKGILVVLMILMAVMFLLVTPNVTLAGKPTPRPTSTPTPTATPTPTPIPGATPTPLTGTAYWKFNESSGTTAADSWGSNTGTVIGATWTTFGVSGNALVFDGVAGYVNLGKTDIVPPWTAAMWVNRQDSTAASCALMSSTSCALKLEQYNNTNQVGFTKFGTADYTFNYTAPIGMWVHLVFTGTSSGTSLYVNGALQGTNSGVISCPMGKIGMENSAGYLKGILDEVKIYSKALSAMEVFALYHSLPTPTPPPTPTPLPTIPPIIPRPVSYSGGTGNFTLTGSAAIYVQGNNTTETDEIYNNTGLYLAGKLNPATGFSLSVVKGNNPPTGSIYLTTVAGDPSLGSEGYSMNITSATVTIAAYTPEGLFRGIQTLRQLFPADIEKSSVVTGIPWVVPCSTIRDYPAYGWRGYMLDVARHFFTVADVKRQIDLMAEYKINQFHMHLTDDQGWRIEIKSWPNLAIIGGNTDYSGGPGGYYTQVQFTDIVNYAKARYITLVPEIDMPGHCSAAIRAYSQLGSGGNLYPRQESTYTFITNVMNEMAPLTPGTYIHIGGDESSLAASDYDYFIGRANDIVAATGKKMIGWNPIDTTSGIHTDSMLQHWSGSYSSAQSKGILIILSPAEKAYFDMKYDSSNTYGQTWAGYVPTNTAYGWDPTNYVSQTQTVGVEAPLWSEYIDTVSKIDFMTYPRLSSLAEVGWTPLIMRNWTDYKTRLKAHGPRMTNLGINFYHDPVVPW